MPSRLFIKCNRHYGLILTVFNNRHGFSVFQNFRPRSPDGKSSVLNSSSNNKLTPARQEDLSSVGFAEEPELIDLCDPSGHIWVHERCAAWTLASIATKSAAEFTVDLTNEILSKVSGKNNCSLRFEEN